MTEKDKKEILERVYVVPLRKEWLKVAKHKRAKKAVKALKEFLVRHMKSEKIRIGKELNEALWARGIRNPPHKVKINVVKYDDDSIKVNLFGVKNKEEKKQESKKEKKEEKTKEVKKESKAKKDEKNKDKEEQKEAKKQQNKEDIKIKKSKERSKKSE